MALPRECELRIEAQANDFFDEFQVFARVAGERFGENLGDGAVSTLCVAWQLAGLLAILEGFRQAGVPVENVNGHTR